MMVGITNFDLEEMNKITDYEKFNHSAKHVSRKIALNFIRTNGHIDYDLQELYIIRMFNRRSVFKISDNKVCYDFFRKRFQDWVYMAIQDLGFPERADDYNYNPKLTIKKV